MLRFERSMLSRPRNHRRQPLEKNAPVTILIQAEKFARLQI
jgi:hypothetical protein